MPSDERTLRNGSSTKTAAVKAEDVQEGNNRAGNLQVATDRILDRLIDMLKVYIYVESGSNKSCFLHTWMICVRMSRSRSPIPV